MKQLDLKDMVMSCMSNSAPRVTFCCPSQLMERRGCGIRRPEPSWPFSRPNGILRRALFSPDGRLVLTALNDNTARLWKTDGTEFRVLGGHENRVSAAAFNPNGLLVATGSLDGTARIWSIKDGGVVATLNGHREPLTDIAFSPDSQLIVTSSRDRTARIWSVENGTERAILRGHTGGVNHAAFSPDGLHLVTLSSQDRTVRLWNVKSGRELAILADQKDAADAELASTSATFNSDGSKIAVVSGDENVRIIRVFPTPQILFIMPIALSRAN